MISYDIILQYEASSRLIFWVIL